MKHNISSGRLRELVQIVKPKVNEVDTYGEPSNDYSLVFDARANVKVQSGQQVEQSTSAFTHQAITVLMWYNNQLSTDLKLVWDELVYDIVNIQPSDDDISVIVTAKLVGKFKFPNADSLTTDSGDILTTDSGDTLVRDE